MDRWYSSSLDTPLPETLDVKKTHGRASMKGLFHPELWIDFSVSLATRSALKGLGRGGLLSHCGYEYSFSDPSSCFVDMEAICLHLAISTHTWVGPRDGGMCPKPGQKVSGLRVW